MQEAEINSTLNCDRSTSIWNRAAMQGDCGTTPSGGVRVASEMCSFKSKKDKLRVQPRGRGSAPEIDGQHAGDGRDKLVEGLRVLKKTSHLVALAFMGLKIRGL